jgi:hypothetical protein
MRPKKEMHGARGGFNTFCLPLDLPPTLLGSSTNPTRLLRWGVRAMTTPDDQGFEFRRESGYFFLNNVEALSGAPTGLSFNC